jgi:hypothetical protein
MMRLPHATLIVGALALVLGAGRLSAEEKGGAASKSDHLDRLAAKLKLDDKQKQAIRKIQDDYDAKADPVEHEFWTLVRGEFEDMKKVLTDAQRSQLPEIVKGIHEQEMQKFAKELQLNDAQKGKIGTICETFEPKFQALAAQTDKGDGLPRQFRELRSQMVSQIRAELTDEQREKLPVVLREEHRYWRNPELRLQRIKTACDKLGVNGDQKAQIARIEDEYEPKIKAKYAEMKKLHQEEQTAIEKGLTDEQRTTWREMHKGRVGTDRTNEQK